jgi:hypothetical protein
MTNQNSKYENRKRRFDPELLKKGLRCDLDQYEMLKCCSDKKDMTEWNKWRLANPNEDIFLEGSNFWRANLQNAKLWGVNLQDASLEGVNLQGADLYNANLQVANLGGANLQGAYLNNTRLQRADFTTAVVDGGTLIWECKVNRYSKSERFTNFEGVGLDSVRIDPATKQLLEYNIRRQNWEDWYKKGFLLRRILKRLSTQPFWWISDYGMSTWRIIFNFSGLAILFAIIYYLCGRFKPPGIVENLFVDRNEIVVPSWLVPLRTLYFSVVTMTTLGFGDMYANAQSIWGHILLSLQVILGYVLLGALVTRFAVLFTAGGPAGRFAEDRRLQMTQSNEIASSLRP